MTDVNKTLSEKENSTLTKSEKDNSTLTKSEKENSTLKYRKVITIVKNEVQNFGTECLKFWHKRKRKIVKRISLDQGQARILEKGPNSIQFNSIQFKFKDRIHSQTEGIGQ